MKSLKLTLVLSLLFNVTLIGVGSFVVYKKGGINFIKNQIAAVSSKKEFPDYYLQKNSIFESTTIKQADKIFIGDSITDHGEFQEYFPNQTVLNRGISNDNSKGVLNRIDEVIRYNPKEVYLMIGVNDILYSTKLQEFEENIKSIVGRFEDTETKLYIQSILPVNSDIYGNGVSNETVTQFNDSLRSISASYNVKYFDLNSFFADDKGQLKKEFTIDGIHLTGEGYKEWINVINE